MCISAKTASKTTWKAGSRQRWKLLNKFCEQSSETSSIKSHSLVRQNIPNTKKKMHALTYRTRMAHSRAQTLHMVPLQSIKPNSILNSKDHMSLNLKHFHNCLTTNCAHHSIVKVSETRTILRKSEKLTEVWEYVCLRFRGQTQNIRRLRCHSFEHYKQTHVAWWMTTIFIWQPG